MLAACGAGLPAPVGDGASQCLTALRVRAELTAAACLRAQPCTAARRLQPCPPALRSSARIVCCMQRSPARRRARRASSTQAAPASRAAAARRVLRWGNGARVTDSQCTGHGSRCPRSRACRTGAGCARARRRTRPAQALRRCPRRRRCSSCGAASPCAARAVALPCPAIIRLRRLGATWRPRMPGRARALHPALELPASRAGGGRCQRPSGAYGACAPGAAQRFQGMHRQARPSATARA